MCLWLKGRELNYKCQYFDSDYLRVFLGYFFDWGGGRVAFSNWTSKILGLWKRALVFFRNALTFIACILFLIQKTCIERREKSHQLSVAWSIKLCGCGFPVNFFKIGEIFYKDWNLEMIVFKASIKIIATFPPPRSPSAVCSTSLVRLKRYELILHGRILLTTCTVWCT